MNKFGYSPIHNLARIILGCLIACTIGCGSGGGGGSDVAVGGSGPHGDAGDNGCSALGLQSRILTGSECLRANAPLPQLTLLGKDGSGGVCTGVLISPTKVLTAGHCLTKFVLKKVFAQFDGLDIEVSSWKTHPDFVYPQNDIGIVTLSTPVSITPVSLALSRPVRSGDVISIFGYGDDGDKITGNLRSGQMTVGGINSQFIKAEYNKSSSGVCAGDSGGPAVMQFKDGNGQTVTGIVGITSFTQVTTCAPGEIAFFSNTQGSLILKFITDEVPTVGAV